MWILTGPFDGGATGDVNFQKSKLLKTGTTYALGRKGCPLIVANKKVSTNQGEFMIGPFTVDDVGVPTSRPTIQYISKKEKVVIRVARDGGRSEVFINPHAAEELQDGDVLSIVSNIQLTLKWMEICCYIEPVRGKSPVSLEGCASLGLHVVHVPSRQVTHHLLSTYSANLVITASLLSACQFVKPDWLNELIRLGNLPQPSDPANGIPLEQTFDLPPTSKYRPGYSTSLSLAQKEFRVWEPNEERVSIFAEYRFLCVDDKGRELAGDFRELIERGGGSFETFDPNTGRGRFHKALARGQAKEGKKLVVVGKQESIQAAVGKDGWKELVAEAKVFGLTFIEPEVVVQVVIDTDVTLFAARSSTDMEVDEASFPDVIPNTHSDEPSIPPPEPEQRTGPSRRLIRRATSRQPSQEPASALEPISLPVSELEPEEPPSLPRPRRALTRRLNAGVPVVTGLDDPSSILDSVPDLSLPGPLPQPVLNLTAPTPARLSKLKRRVVGGASDQLGGQPFALDLEEAAEEPPLKKFKALFDASNQENFDETAFEDIQSGTYTQTQSETQSRSERSHRSGAVTNLTTLREEEEETQDSSHKSRGTKRPIAEVEDIAVDDVDSDTLASGSGPSLPKKRAVQALNAVESASAKASSATAVAEPNARSTSESPVKSKCGAQPGKPDQDQAFLKAIASTKRGKKTEDEFDREFNKLKISKPVLGREDPEEEWAVLAEFGDETNVRGNFMMIVEMAAYNRGARDRRRGEPVPEWDGKPNFKKFQKKTGPKRTATVELFMNESQEYGVGPGYWEDGGSQDNGDFPPTQRRTEVQQDVATSQIQPNGNKPRSKAAVVFDSDEDKAESVAPLRRGKSKASSRASSIAPAPTCTATRSTRATTAAKAQPLFISSGEDDDDFKPGPKIEEKDADELMDDFDDDETLPSTAGTIRIKTATQKPPSSSSRTRAQPSRAKKPAAAIVVDDHSDDGAVFKGFRGKQRRR